MYTSTCSLLLLYSNTFIMTLQTIQGWIVWIFDCCTHYHSRGQNGPYRRPPRDQHAPFSIAPSRAQKYPSCCGYSGVGNLLCTGSGCWLLGKYRGKTGHCSNTFTKHFYIVSYFLSDKLKIGVWEIVPGCYELRVNGLKSKCTGQNFHTTVLLCPVASLLSSKCY